MLENSALSKNKRAEYKYRVPDDLMVSTTAVKRFLVVGSCMAAGMYTWAHKVLIGAEVDHLLYNFPGDVVEAPRPRAVEVEDASEPLACNQRHHDFRL